MDKLVERLPSAAGLALWLYAAAFVVLPALLAYKGFAYVLGIVIFAVGLRPHVEALASGHPVTLGLRWRGRHYERRITVSLASERVAVKAVSWLLLALTVLILPLLVFVIQAQGQVFYAQLETQLPAIIAEIGRLLDIAHERLPGYVPDVEVEKGAGWSGLSSIFGQVAGDAVADIKAVLKSIFGSLLTVLGSLLGDWVKLVIAAIVVGTILAGWDKEAKMHRAIVASGLKDPALRRNALRFGELYQTGVSLFMIGYLEVAATLSLFYILAMLILPLGLEVGAILFTGVILGFVTAIPKIGGFGGMAIAFVLMISRLEPGLGWFGYQVLSFGTAVDILIRVAVMLAVAKLMGLLEAYRYTPDVVGEKLGMTKMQIIATVLIWAIGAGFFGMIWGILISLTFQAALRLAEERAGEAAGEADAAPPSA